ncbi:MAG: DUF2330 domain-containing protein [Planctomycetes bacterium]|nr:DUF2330 domain-containing protein [Planctomycetota bacterium]
MNNFSIPVWPWVALMLFGLPLSADAACCYFSAKNADILQPAQKAFITWDPAEKIETFTVQPKFEGNALDFGMVIPTPTQPKLNEMPRDFFRHLAIYTIMKRRQHPHSRLLDILEPRKLDEAKKSDPSDKSPPPTSKDPGRPKVVVLESGVVGSLDYKIITAEKADDLYQWLKDNKYNYSGDEATLNHYVQKKWIFTVMKIDTMQMKRNKDGTFAGEVTPTRFKFTSEKLIYPLKITQISVRDKTEALFYVQAPYKVDLAGDMTYQYMWIPSLEGAVGCTSTGIPGGGDAWLKAFGPQIPALKAQAAMLQFRFFPGVRPGPGKDGRIMTTMEWARKLTKDDVSILTGKYPYSEPVPDVDAGFTEADARDPARAAAIVKVIRDRLNKSRMKHPDGYLVRHAPANELRDLQLLSGHLTAGLFITKFRKLFTRGEMNDDLLILPARYNGAEDNSEYEEMLPTSPP